MKFFQRSFLVLIALVFSLSCGEESSKNSPKGSANSNNNNQNSKGSSGNSSANGNSGEGKGSGTNGTGKTENKEKEKTPEPENKKPVDPCKKVDPGKAIDESYKELLQLFPSNYPDFLKSFIALRDFYGSNPLNGQVFWFVSNDDKDFYLSGEFNKWKKSDPNFKLQKQKNSKYGFFLFSYLSKSPLKGKYKFYRADNDQFFADPNASYFDPYDQFGEISLLAQANWRRSPEIYGPDLRNIVSYFPKSFDKSKKYPLMLMLDGQNIFSKCKMSNCWKVDESIEKNKLEIVITGISNGGTRRINEYSFVKQKIKDKVYGGDGQKHLSWIMESVLPKLACKYNVKTKKIALSGSSMGGLLTLRAWQKYSDRFFFNGALSSSLFFGEYNANPKSLLLQLKAAKYEPKDFAPLFLYSGGEAAKGCKDLDNDGFEDDLENSDVYCLNAQLKKLLKDKGFIEDKHFKYFHQAKALHNEATWGWVFEKHLIPFLKPFLTNAK